MTGLTLAVVLRVPTAGVADFQAYEAHVLPLLFEHGGKLERRLRNADGTIEVHVISFASRHAFDAYRADPRRAAAAGLLQASGATAEVIEAVDVAGEEAP